MTDPVPIPLSPDWIRRVDLPRSLQGFDEAATRRLLHNVSARLEQLLAERDELRQKADEHEQLQRRITELEETLSSREDSEQALSRALLAAGRASEELIKTAEGEADEIVQEARGRAEQIGQELDERRKSIEDEREQVRQELRRQVLAATRDDLTRLHNEAQPLLELVQSLSGGLRSLIEEGGSEGTLLEDLRLPADEQQPVPSADDALAD